jgi:hypothetical protein
MDGWIHIMIWMIHIIALLKIMAILIISTNKLSHTIYTISLLIGLHSMSSDVPQVRALLAALADRISLSQCSLSGQGTYCATDDVDEVYMNGCCMMTSIDTNK